MILFHVICNALPDSKLFVLIMAVPSFIALAVKRTSPSGSPVVVVVFIFNNVPVLNRLDVSIVIADPDSKSDALI